MSGLWPLVVILAVLGALIVVAAVGRRLFPGTRLTRWTLRCPFRQHDVDVEFVETVWDGELLDVRQCSLFSPPTAVDCQKDCIKWLQGSGRGRWADIPRPPRGTPRSGLSFPGCAAARGRARRAADA